MLVPGCTATRPLISVGFHRLLVLPSPSMPQSFLPHTYTRPLSQMAPEVLPPACKATTSAGSPLTGTNLLEGVWLPLPSWPHTLAPAGHKTVWAAQRWSVGACDLQAGGGSTTLSNQSTNCPTRLPTTATATYTHTCCKGLDLALVSNQRQGVLQAGSNLHRAAEVAGLSVKAEAGLCGAPPVLEVAGRQLWVWVWAEAKALLM